MSIARHHAEWLSLLEISGPFLSMPVLLDAFPQGLEAHDPEHVRELRAAYEEWADNQGGLQPDPAIHQAWIRYVLGNTLELPDQVLAEGQAIPDSIKTTLPEYGEVLRPSLMVKDPSGKPLLLVQLLPAAQSLEKPLPNQPWKASPATRMMTLLHATEIRLGLVTNGEQWMLVDAPRGETTGFISWYASLWLEEPLTLRAFRSLLGAERFFNVPDEQTLAALLAASTKDQHEVTDQLGYQVRQAVEILIQAIDRADQDRGRALIADMQPERLYEAALTVMMRLVFLLSAEERGLLLLDAPIYAQYYAISTLRAQLREIADRQGEEVLERRFDAWSRLLATFRAVYGGIQHENLKLPAYGGGLFDPDRFPFLEGRPADTHWLTAQAQPLPINNRTVLHLLEALQILQVQVPGGGGAEARRLSFRALDIEQIGHVYEGLLDHVAVRASEPVLGLQGTRSKEPEIPLSILEAQQARGDAALIQYLREETGRSDSALRNALKATIETSHAGRLRRACGNDEALYQRVLPFAALVRDDDYGIPAVIRSGSVYVTAGPTRRATGTHYTPRSLTEPIVQHALEPLVYIGPAEGWPREKWQLRSPAELLALKLCDMAMGSGAFLVQADRYLAERLVESWEMVSKQYSGDGNRLSMDEKLNAELRLLITVEGELTKDPDKAVPADPEDQLRLARRLVADRCLYGVDKNHLAVEMAKLSLWLITLDKNRPFTFLDHALKHGDSLVGADEEMYLRWSESLQGTVGPRYQEENEKALALARQRRQALQAFPVHEVRHAEEKARLLAEADAALARIKRACDLIVGVRMLDDLSESEKETWLAELLIEHTAKEKLTSEKAKRALKAAWQLPAFHWPFEFPEVFAQGGFGAFVGNPPFIGGRRIRETLGDSYRAALYQLYVGSSGNADYCAFFFLRGFDRLRQGGTLGLIATNTIAQGDTRLTGLDVITEQGGVIYNATNDLSWPGQAAVSVNIVHIAKGDAKPPYVLDDKTVQHISSFLDSRQIVGEPYPLVQNEAKSHMGTNVVGIGFIMLPEEAQSLIKKDSRNVDILFPYINGQDLNTNPDQSASRWIINFRDWPLEKAELYPDCMAIVREKVKPQREKVRREVYRKLWWQHAEKQKSLYETIAPLERILICPTVSKYVSFAFVPSTWIYAHRLIVFPFEEYSAFAILQSNFHEAWARRYSSTLETRINYSPTNCFYNFPLADFNSALDSIGFQYYEHRRQLMLTRQEGLTDTYNRFHDPDEDTADIVKLRRFHVKMDNAVAAAYGWDDLDLKHGFHETAQGIRYTISETARREVLMRLLNLNHERYTEEVRLGLHEKRDRKKTSRKGRKKDDEQLSLFG